MWILFVNQHAAHEIGDKSIKVDPGFEDIDDPPYLEVKKYTAKEVFEWAKLDVSLVEICVRHHGCTCNVPAVVSGAYAAVPAGLLGG